MDEIVKQAMGRWPDVPHCFGWLGLDGRGDWFLRDQPSQDRGAFSSGVPGAKGSRLEHAGLIAFIQRNYASDEVGQWYFQNGPQRVYVELEVTPWIWRISDSQEITSHTGIPAQFQSALLDERGWLYLQTSLGCGLVHTQDMMRAAQTAEDQAWELRTLAAQELPQRYHYVQSPQNRLITSTGPAGPLMAAD